MYKITLVLILQVLAVSGAAAAPEIERKGGVSSCHLRELELCSLGAVSMFQNPNGIPVSATEFSRQCEYLRESEDCFQDYRDNCMTKLGANLIETSVKDFGEFGEEFCTNGTKTNQLYMKHATCLRDAQKKHQRPCMADLQVGFEAIHKIPIENRIPTACCNVNKLKDCILPRIEEDCGKEAIEFVRDLLKRAIGRTFVVTCRAFDAKSPKCKALLPRPNQKPNNGRNTSAISKLISTYANAHSM